MNRRQLLSTFAAAPVAALAGTGKESFSSLPLTTHDHKVLSLLYNNLYEWLSWGNRDQPNKMSKEVRHHITRQTMNIFREQYQRSILRHVAGVQPLRHPTGFLYVESETVPALRSPHSQNPYIHTVGCSRSDLKVKLGFGCGVPV